MNSDHYQFELGINLLPGDDGLAVLFSGEGRTRPGHKIGPSVHDYYLVHTVISGQGVFTTTGRTYTCQAGDTFLITPGSLFSYESDRTIPWHYVWVAIQGHNSSKAQSAAKSPQPSSAAASPAQMLKLAGFTPERPLLHLSNLEAVYSLYRNIRLSFRQSANPALESLEASGWLRLLLHSFGHAGSDAAGTAALPDTDMIGRQVEQAVRWISLQYHQQLSVGQMASSLGYHRAHFSKAFKERTGLSPKQYLMKVRMKKAKELLASAALTIDEVSSSVGFNDALYFSKQFRGWYGLSPSEYRSGVKPSRQ